MISQATHWFSTALQTAINHYLALDPHSAPRLQRLKNKIVKVTLLGVNVTFYLHFSTEGVQLSTDEIAADTTIQGTPLRLLHLVLAKEQRQRFFADDVSIQGNLELGQETIQLFDQVDIDWEEQLSRLVGDVPAHHVGNFLRRVNTWRAETKATLRQNINDYIHEEIPLFPPAEALRDFFHDIDELRMDVDRLAAKLQQLHQLAQSKRGAV